MRAMRYFVSDFVAILCITANDKRDIMQTDRRFVLRLLGKGALVPALGASLGAQAAPETLIRLNLPGPGSLSFLPLELITTLQIDRALGARLLLRYHQSGIRAVEDVLTGNSDFAALGFATLPVLQTAGKEAMAIAAIAGEQLIMHMVVRKDLVKSVKSLKDVAGLTLGVSAGSANSKTYLQMMAELLLNAHGVNPQRLRWLPLGQNWEGFSGAFASQSADVVFCEEPFASRLQRAGLGVSILNLSDKRTYAGIGGVNALRTVLATGRAFLNQQEGQRKAQLMVQMLQRSLAWIHENSPEAVALKATAGSPQLRAEIASLLKALPGLYSVNGQFISHSVEETDVFLRSTLKDKNLPPAASLIDARWANQTP
jgi:ABC-type nitrate/sulfonate/bicarbonate transport system substrate-binding protein